MLGDGAIAVVVAVLRPALAAVPVSALTVSLPEALLLPGRRVAASVDRGKA
jgi:hypothetical protein